ncbi:uncharacterized protein LTR77_009913 [Saxophila tyrrhenica]|uniref:Uncharacterized protein n=1 Tax=Saxophila tyrrhenica TaxID=1690608 RepID=A0AAV9NWC4_9PEZI|nr:hypothetical protein LTR77_009913 [Saxophila tyrrhenica]
MATRTARFEDWKSSPQTRIQTRSIREPRDEHALFAKTPPRTRPAPINIAPGEPSPLLKAVPFTGRTSEDRCETPPIPEIVDVAVPNIWPRRGPLQQECFKKRVPTPRLTSGCSTRQSAMSYGILDYYMHEPSPLHSPTFPPPPRIETPVLGPAINEFDFGLVASAKPASPCLPATQPKQAPVPSQDTRPGADRPTPHQSRSTTTTATTPPSQPQPPSDPKATYKLFPSGRELQPTSPSTPTQIHPAYRPRKESISTSSIRSRKDSCTSTQRIQLRTLSGSTNPHSNGSNSSTPTSQSRWSEDTITSPLIASTTPGPRTSFGGLLGPQYPACFFEEEEEDDEAAPLRRKFGLGPKRVKATEIRGGKGRFEERRGGWGWVRRVVLCGCGG